MFGKDAKLLQESLAFRLSLSSKELFHSNLLSYYFERYPQLLRPFLGECSIGINSCTVEREKHLGKKGAIDLKVEYARNDGSCGVLFIENKLKSSPNKDQLEDYRSEIVKSTPDARCVLLSPLRPRFIDDTLGWHHVSYEAVVQALEAFVEDPATDPKVFDAAFLVDYTVSLGALSRILGRAQSLAQAPTTKYAQLLEAIDADRKDLRIYDAIAKSMFSELENDWNQRYAAARDFKKNGLAFLDIESGFAAKRRTGQLTISYQSGDVARIGVQLEGAGIRPFVSNLSRRTEVPDDVREKWLSREILVGDVKIKPDGLTRNSKNGKVGEDRSFELANGKWFFYREATIPSEATVGDVLGAIGKMTGYLMGASAGGEKWLKHLSEIAQLATKKR